MSAYRCVMADPPWKFAGGGSGWKCGANLHYSLLSESEIVDVMREPMSGVNADAHLWLWVVSNHLPEGLRVMDALGFRYITNLAWVKFQRGGLDIGVGQYLRGAHELCLFGVRGRTQMPPVRNIPSVVMAPRTKHSRKPDEAYRAISRVSPGPRLSLFDRELREGWDVWGDEAPEAGAAS